MELALGDPLIVRHVLLQAAAGDARSVGRLAKAGRMFWQGSNGSSAQVCACRRAWPASCMRMSPTPSLLTPGIDPT